MEDHTCSQTLGPILSEAKVNDELYDVVGKKVLECAEAAPNPLAHDVLMLGSYCSTQR